MARDDIATTDAQVVVLAIRRYLYHPAVLAAGLQQPLAALVQYVTETERRLESLQRRVAELEKATAVPGGN